jgi:hypothetical protein
VLVGVALVLAVDTGYPVVLVVAYAGLVGTVVDLDHFFIARARTGSWAPLVRSLSDPRMALFEQDDIFESGDVGRWTRLGSHALVTVVLSGILLWVATSLAVVTAVVLGVHVCCDIVWDQWRVRGA